MKKALDQAVQAFDQGEVPVGAVIVFEERIIAEACNQREMLQDPTAHAEMIAITQAAESIGSWRLLNCTLYRGDVRFLLSAGFDSAILAAHGT